MEAIKVENISKSYKGVNALKNISFSTEKGELFGIIGPDGAGKTTLFRVMATLLLADSGSALIDGLDAVKDYKKIRGRVGYMPGKFSLYQDLSVEENLNFFATLFGTTVKENYHLIKDIYVQIEPFKKRRAGALSGGMKQKLALCCALIHSPSVLFLDEPTTGVDPVSRKEFWEMLKRLKQQNISILVSTPYMDEALLCDRIAMIKNGEFIGIDTPKKIIENFDEPLFAISAKKMYNLLNILRSSSMVKSAYAFGDVHHITLNSGFRQEDIYKYLIDRGVEDLDLHIIMAGIEDCYIKLTKK